MNIVREHFPSLWKRRRLSLYTLLEVDLEDTLFPPYTPGVTPLPPTLPAISLREVPLLFLFPARQIHTATYTRTRAINKFMAGCLVVVSHNVRFHPTVVSATPFVIHSAPPRTQRQREERARVNPGARERKLGLESGFRKWLNKNKQNNREQRTTKRLSGREEERVRGRENVELQKRVRRK